MPIHTLTPQFASPYPGPRYIPRKPGTSTMYSTVFFHSISLCCNISPRIVSQDILHQKYELILHVFLIPSLKSSIRKLHPLTHILSSPGLPNPLQKKAPAPAPELPHRAQSDNQAHQYGLRNPSPTSQGLDNHIPHPANPTGQAEPAQGPELHQHPRPL